MRRCIFCGGRVSSREHAWPEWILDLFTVASRVTFQFGEDSNNSNNTRSWRGDGRSAHIRFRHLCGACNHGWLSDLETSVRPIVGPIMHDFSIRLNAGDQARIAAWCVKTAMVFECGNPRNHWFYSDGERAHLRATLLPPAGTLVWLGRHERSDLALCDGRKLFRSESNSPLIVGEGYVTTLAMARLVVQVLTIRRSPEYENQPIRITLDVKRGPWVGSLIQVWPSVTTTRWPPAESFSEIGIERLSERFTNPWG